MNMNKKEMTTPNVSVGPDTEQSSTKCNMGIISDTIENINGYEEKD